MKQFSFKTVDPEGLQTLETLADAYRFNQWMFQSIQPFIQAGEILEIGSGIGNISRFFLEKNYPIYLSDIRSHYCQALSEQYAGHPTLKGISQIDLVAPDFEASYPALLGRFANIYSLNVIEHIEDDYQAIRNCAKLLKPKGKLIILVPAYPWLYNRFDKELYHYRRYTHEMMASCFETGGFNITDSFHLNAVGILGWFVSGALLRHKTIPSYQMSLYERLVPYIKQVDKLVASQVGLSLVMIGEKR